MTNKNKNETKEKNWKTHYREKCYFPSACANYQFVFLNTNNYFVGFSKLLNHLLSYNL